MLHTLSDMISFSVNGVYCLHKNYVAYSSLKPVAELVYISALVGGMWYLYLYFLSLDTIPDTAPLML